jgi:hypothetical protein
MTTHDAMIRAASKTRRFEPPNCPQCGDRPFLPQTAEFVGQGRIRHTWVCEGCGHTFRTAIQIPEARWAPSISPQLRNVRPF